MQFVISALGHLHDVLGDVHWSPQRLRHEVMRRAAVLQRLGGRDAVGPPRYVIAHANTPSFFADLLAVWRAGGCAVCVNPGLTAAELANVLGFVQARAVLVGEAGHAAAPAGVPVLCTAREPAALQASGAAAVPAAGGPATLDDAALVLFTSGTTGHPKGVVLSHRALLARVALNQAHIGRAALARTLCVLPTHFGHGLIGNALTPLLAGGDVWLMAGAGVAGAARLGELVQRQQITFMSSVPAFWRLALRTAPPPQPGVLQRVHIGSAPLSAALWCEVMAWAGTRAVANTYGITEAANWIGGALGSEQAPADGLVGRCWGGRWAVLGADGELRDGGEGEVLVQTPALMSGYWARPELSAQVLTGGWYRTGDLGRLAADGTLHLTGRETALINRGGIKVHPEELDLLFERHPQVLEACAFALPDPVAGEAVGLALVLRAGSTPAPTAADFTHWARTRIRPDALPARIFVVDQIPKTERGKLKRQQVAQACLGEPAGGAAPGGAPRSVRVPL